MNREKFEEAVRDLKPGDRVQIFFHKLNYGNCRREDVLEKIEGNLFFFRKFGCRRYKNIKGIRKIREVE